MFGVVPLFGFVSAGVTLDGDASLVAGPLPLAIIAGLFLGKQFGIFAVIWMVVRSGLAPPPHHTSWRQLYGASVLCGIGFTMSLFIGALAFPGNPALVDQAKIGIIAGSLLSAVLGYLVLRFSPPVASSREDIGEAGELFGADQDR
jgi:NhaA family Na+:H+ antiporter